MTTLERATAPAAVAPAATEWLSIREASGLVGVSVATLRRWCDAGRVPVFTTPGGHRRFSRAALMGLIPTDDEAWPLADETDTTSRIVRGFQRANLRGSRQPPLDRIAPSDRAELRQHGRQIVTALVEALDAPPLDEAMHCARARSAAAACGQIAGEAGMSLQEALSVFVRFRAPFLHELGSVCQRRGLDGAASTAVLERASNILDRLLPAVVAGFQSGAATP